MNAGRFVAVDWGTTNRRTYVIEGNAIAESESDATGVLAVAPGGFPSEIDRLRARFGNAPMLLAGMVGSNRGWVDAGYVDCPATLATLAAGLIEPEPRVRIVPGVSVIANGRGDVMRGEEVQLLGAVAARQTPPDALLCQPGTHCKWARMMDGALASFATAMTGELFALLRDHALIGAAMSAPVTAGDAFQRGMARSGESDLSTALFGVRADSLLGTRADSDAASYVSGLLIGADVRAHVAAGETVHILADAALGALYATAIGAVGGTSIAVDSHAAFVAGIVRLWELAS